MKSKEQLAEDYTNSDYFRLEYSTFGTTAKECQKAFLAGFQKSEEMHKELIKECAEKLFLAWDHLEAGSELSLSINELLQKIRMRE